MIMTLHALPLAPLPTKQVRGFYTIVAAEMSNYNVKGNGIINGNHRVIESNSQTL